MRNKITLLLFVGLFMLFLGAFLGIPSADAEIITNRPQTTQTAMAKYWCSNYDLNCPTAPPSLNTPPPYPGPAFSTPEGCVSTYPGIWECSGSIFEGAAGSPEEVMIDRGVAEYETQEDSPTATPKPMLIPRPGRHR